MNAPNTVVETYEEACQLVNQWGIIPLSGFIPSHPSLDAVTRPQAWHTGAITDPWLWRDRFAIDGMAAYGRFIGGKPLLVSREIFPLLYDLLHPSEPIEDRYHAGILAKSTVRIYDLIRENDGIDVKTLRKLANMQEKSAKNTFDHALIDLQSTADVVISGISARLNEHGNKNGWNSTCYLLAERWMQQHGLEAGQFARSDAATKLFAWIEPRWDANAVHFLHKKLSSI